MAYIGPGIFPSCFAHSYLRPIQKHSFLLEKPAYGLSFQEFILFKQAFKVLLHIADPSTQLGLLVVHYFFPAAIPTSRPASQQAIRVSLELGYVSSCTTNLVFYCVLHCFE
jgi:hypothetical protein